jgi:hypothetical protein
MMNVALNQPGRAGATDASYDALLRLLVGPWIAQAIFVAAKLDIADRLRDAPQPAAALAAASGADPAALKRVLRALASVGVFSERDDGHFCLTPLAQGLRSDDPNSLRDYAIMAFARRDAAQRAQRRDRVRARVRCADLRILRGPSRCGVDFGQGPRGTQRAGEYRDPCGV